MARIFQAVVSMAGFSVFCTTVSMSLLSDASASSFSIDIVCLLYCCAVAVFVSRFKISRVPNQSPKGALTHAMHHTDKLLSKRVVEMDREPAKVGDTGRTKNMSVLVWIISPPPCLCTVANYYRMYMVTPAQSYFTSV